MFNDVFSVLLVDDEPLPRRLLGDRISKIPDVVLAASFSDGSQAAAFLKENIVDLVITDIKMPVMDGLELASFIQKLDPGCTTVIVSGYSEFEYARKALQYGVHDYLLKPLSFTQVVELIERCHYKKTKARNRLLLPRFSKFQTLETTIATHPLELWQSEVDALLVNPGTVISITPSMSEHTSRSSLKNVYKNILSEALPYTDVLTLERAGVDFLYLLIHAPDSPHRSLRAVSEHLNRILAHTAVWSELAVVHSAKDVAALLAHDASKNPSDVIAIACDYMKHHLGETLTRDEVASQVFLSPSYFGQLFKKTMGIGYNDYLTDLRITHAKKLLAQNVSIREIATAVGFRDAKYFSEVFYKKTGYVPSEYRRLNLTRSLKQDDDA